MYSGLKLIGVGNAFRNDDGVGIELAKRLSAQLPGSEFIQASGEGAGLMESWSNSKLVYLFDAVSSGNQAGTVHRFDVNQQPIPRGFFNYSTHAFSVAEAVEMARVLDELPDSMVIYGIEGTNFDMGSTISDDVFAACDELEPQVIEEIRGRYNA
ncbi:hydrogenase maturation protease [Pseudomonadota bacterium]